MSMNNFFGMAMGLAMSFEASPFMVTQRQVDERRIELRQSWQDSKVLPRKTKKRVRKELLLQWDMNECHNVTFSSTFF